MTERDGPSGDVVLPQALARIVRDMDRGLLADPRRVQGMLSDALGVDGRTWRAEIDGIVTAVEESIPEALLTDAIDVEGAVHRLGHRGLDDGFARFVVELWQYALWLLPPGSPPPSRANGPVLPAVGVEEPVAIDTDDPGLPPTAMPDLVEVAPTETAGDRPSSRRRRLAVVGAMAGLLVLVTTVAALTIRNNDLAQGPSPGALVAAGGSHSCGIKVDGAVVCWGADRYGQSSPPGAQFAEVSVAALHSCGITTDGSIICWGNDGYGRATAPEGRFG